MDNNKTIDSLKSFVGKYKGWIIAIFILIISIYTFISFKPDGYESLYPNLTETDRQQIVVELSKLGVEYKIDETTQGISVKKQDIAWIRKEMNNLGLPTNSSGVEGYDIFLESSLGSTKKDLELRELTARKGQLERELVRSFSFINTATVNFDTPAQASIFEKEEKSGKASVNIGFKRGANITKQQLLGIQHMVSSAIPGVNPEDVTVIDSEKGVISDDLMGEEQAYSSSYEKQLAIKSQTETNIHDDVKKSLTSLFGYENVQINVNVAINFDEIVQNIEKYDDEGVLRSKNTNNEDTVKVDGVEGTEAGLDANGEVVGYDSTTGDGNVVYQQKKENMIENFEISKTVETVRKNPQLTNTNVTVWVDQAKLDEKNVDVNQLRQAVGVASGLTFDQATDTFQNGQVIVFSTNMEEVPKVEEKPEEVVEETFFDKYGIILVVGIGVLLLVVFVLVYLVMNKRKKDRENAEKAALTTVETLLKQQAEQHGIPKPTTYYDDDGEIQVKYSAVQDGSEEIIETDADRIKRLKEEKTHKDLSDEVGKLSNDHPKETAEYIKKLLKDERK